jgi:hypothetical protein
MAHSFTTEITDADEKWVDEIVKPYRSYITDTPELLSLLYDIDLMPEQIVLPVNAIRMAAFCEVWKRFNTKSE